MYYLLLFLPFVIGISKEFESTIPRHDTVMTTFSIEHISDNSSANMCGVYLCPTLPDHATAYIQEGCEGDFSDWVSTIHPKETILFQQDSANSVSEPFCVTPETLFILMMLSVSVSFILGWREYSFQQKYNRIKIDQMD